MPENIEGLLKKPKRYQSPDSPPEEKPKVWIHCEACTTVTEHTDGPMESPWDGTDMRGHLTCDFCGVLKPGIYPRIQGPQVLVKTPETREELLQRPKRPKPAPEYLLPLISRKPLVLGHCQTCGGITDHHEVPERTEKWDDEFEGIEYTARGRLIYKLCRRLRENVDYCDLLEQYWGSVIK